MKEIKGIDVTNFKSDREHEFHPYFGPIEKVPFKKGMLNSPSKGVSDAVVFSITERYHDKDGVLRLRKIKYKVDSEGNRIRVSD